MNIQQFYDEKERAEREKAEQHITEHPQLGATNASSSSQHDGTTVIPVIQETAQLHKELVESAKVWVQTKVVEVQKSIDVPLTKEAYEVKRVPIGELIDEHPPVRQEGNSIIVPVVEEVLVVQKRLRLVEEVHLIKQQTTVTKTETFIVKKEEVTVEREPTGNKRIG